jgi:hypothetical protein
LFLQADGGDRTFSFFIGSVLLAGSLGAKTHNEKTKRQEEALRVFDVYDCASEIKCSIYRDRLDMTTSGQQSEIAGCPFA